jgi:AcrR family transcriptional regulator
VSRPPIWAREEPRGRSARAALSRRQIVAAALTLADQEGLEAVSMRRIAKELGAGAMSLYHYFDSRDELLVLMADAVGAEMLVPDLPDQWRAALTEIARHSRAAFLNHPWLLPGLRAGATVTPNLLRHIEQSAQAVATLQAPPELLHAIVSAVDDYTIGFTERELARGARISDDFEVPEVRYLLESGEFPLIEQFLTSGARLPEPDFELGLSWLLDGFAARIG